MSSNDDETVEIAELEPAQELAVQFMLQNYQQGCINALPMGSGKTGQTWTLVRRLLEDGREHLKVIILCPAYLQENWMREAVKWLKYSREKRSQSLVVNPQQFEEDATRARALLVFARASKATAILSYETWQSWLKTTPKPYAKDLEQLGKTERQAAEMIGLALRRPNLLVCDEAHCLRKPDSKCAKTIGLELDRTKTGLVLLTGTPVENRLSDLYNLVVLARPTQDADGPFAGGRNHFVKTFSIPIKRAIKARNQGELKAKCDELRRYWAETMTRHYESEKPLPRLHEYVVLVEVVAEQETAFRQDAAASAAKQASKRAAGGDAQPSDGSQDLVVVVEDDGCKPKGAARFSRERKIGAHELTLRIDKSDDNTCWRKNKDEIVRHTLANAAPRGKVRFCIDLIARLARDEKCVIFCASEVTVQAIAYYVGQHLQPHEIGRISGDLGIKLRDCVCQRINDPRDGMRVVIATTGAAGNGLNMQGANVVVMFDVEWNASTARQAIARVHRKGQQRECRAYHLVHASDVLNDRRVMLSHLVKLAGAMAVLDNATVSVPDRLEAVERNVAQAGGVAKPWVEIDLNSLMK